MFLDQALIQRGFTDMNLQVGRGSVVPDPESCPGLKLQVFRFKDSIAEDMRHSDLIISHAGGLNLYLPRRQRLKKEQEN